MACAKYRIRKGKTTGHWHLDFRDQTGKRQIIQLSRLTKDNEKDKAEAHKQLLRYAVSVEDGTFIARSEQIDFQQLSERYLAQTRVRALTKIDYERIIYTRLKEHFKSMKLRAITSLLVEQYRTAMEKAGKSVNTINKDLTVLSMMFRYAKFHRWVVHNPCEGVKKLRQSIDKKRAAMDGNILTAEEVQRLIDAAGSPRDHALFHMAAFTGMRQGELVALRWDDVDFDRSQLHVRRSFRKGVESPPKTAASIRCMGLTPELIGELKQWKLQCPQMEGHGHVLVFPNSKGGFIAHYNLLRRSFFPALKRAGLRRIRFHDLRHTASSLLLSRGVQSKIVQAQLGHASSAITNDVYGHLLPGDHAGGARAMAGVFSAITPNAEPPPRTGNQPSNILSFRRA